MHIDHFNTTCNGVSILPEWRRKIKGLLLILVRTFSLGFIATVWAACLFVSFIYLCVGVEGLVLPSLCRSGGFARSLDFLISMFSAIGGFLFSCLLICVAIDLIKPIWLKILKKLRETWKVYLANDKGILRKRKIFWLKAKRTATTYSTLQLVTAALLIWALARNPSDYYVLLKFLVCPVTAFGAFRAFRLDKTGWSWIMGSFSLLFNPVTPVHLEPETWRTIDLLLSIIIVYSRFDLNSVNNRTRAEIKAFSVLSVLLVAAISYIGFGDGATIFWNLPNNNLGSEY